MELGLHVNIGMETISPESLKAINKKQNRIREYERQFKALRDRGIGFSVNVMFGLNGDYPDIFDATVDFLIRVKAPVSFVFILAPRPGSRVREQLLQVDQLLRLQGSLPTPAHDTPAAGGRLLAGQPEILFFTFHPEAANPPPIFLAHVAL